MGKVAMKIKVFPESIEAFESMKKKVIEKMKPAQSEEVPVAFGLKALRVTLVMEDKEGSGDKEEEIRKIEGVGEVEVEMVTLL